MCVFHRVFSNLAAEGDPPDALMIDLAHLKAHWTACNLLKRGGSSPPHWANERQPEYKSCMRYVTAEAVL